MRLQWVLLTFFAFQSQANAAHYEFLPVEEKFFSDCPDPSPGTRNVSGLFDLSHATFTLSADGLGVEGKLISVWDIQQEDRVEVTANSFYLNRGTWQPTVFSLSSNDFCSEMYDERQYWYKYWAKYIRNAEGIKDRCMNVPGTEFLMETYILIMRVVSNAKLREGLYKGRMTFRAFDSMGVERPTSICYEFIGDLFKI